MKVARACAVNCFFAFMLFNAAASGLAAESERSVTPSGEKRPDNNPNMQTKRIGLAIHGGAGTIERSNMTPEKEREYRAGLERALTAGYEILKRGGSSLDATEAAVRVLEDDPHFNAGRGSVFTSAGTKAVGPGRHSTFTSALIDSLTRRKAGSEMPGVPASVTRAIDLPACNCSTRCCKTLCSLC